VAYVRVDSAVKYFAREAGDDMLVLGKVSFDAKENGMTCLLGPSGCGKSTLLNVISGLEALDQGRVEIVSDKATALMCRALVMSSRIPGSSTGSEWKAT